MSETLSSNPRNARLQAAREYCQTNTNHGEGLRAAFIAGAEWANRTAHETPAPQVPIARVTISDDGMAVRTGLYAPGLPPGNHDLYCVPDAVAPMMRAEETPAHDRRVDGWCHTCSSYTCSAQKASVAREQANAVALECAQSTRRSVDAIQASEKAAASAVLNLACEQFTPDPNSRFCDKCGYPQHDHQTRCERER